MISEAWRDATLAVPNHYRFRDDDPMMPFVAWMTSPRHRMSGQRAKLTATSLRRMLAFFTIDEILTGDMDALALRVPWVAERVEMGRAQGVHAQPYRRAVRLLREFCAEADALDTRAARVSGDV